MNAFLSRQWSRPVIRGLSMMALMRYSTKGFSLVRLAIIAQFLPPSALGAFTLALLIISITEIFTETGINIFLLKSPKKLDQYIHTAWGVSLIRGLLISLFIIGATPFLASFYQDTSLQTYFLFAAFIPFVRGLINPAIIEYQQNLAFEKESLLRIFLQMLDMITGLIFAFVWKSALGLLGGVLVAAIVEVGLSFFLFSRRPNLKLFQPKLVLSLYKETRTIIANGIVTFLTTNLDSFIIGRVLGLTGLGLYQAGYKLASATTTDFGSLVGQTLYPLYAKLHNEGKPVSPLLAKSSVLMIVLFAIMALPMLVFTDSLVRLILQKDEWLAIIPLIRVLFLAGVLKSFVMSWNPLSILAQNLSHFVFMNILSSLILSLGILFLAPQWGITGAGLAVFFAAAFVQPYAWFVLQEAKKRLDNT